MLLDELIAMFSLELAPGAVLVTPRNAKYRRVEKERARVSAKALVDSAPEEEEAAADEEGEEEEDLRLRSAVYDCLDLLSVFGFLISHLWFPYSKGALID